MLPWVCSTLYTTWVCTTLYTPGYVAPCTPLGTPSHRPSWLQYTSRVHRESHLAALTRGVTERCVSGEPLTVTRFTVGR